jgi:hypothetical protein
MLPPIINGPVLLKIRKGISFLPDRSQLDGVLSRGTQRSIRGNRWANSFRLSRDLLMAKSESR